MGLLVAPIANWDFPHSPHPVLNLSTSQINTEPKGGPISTWVCPLVVFLLASLFTTPKTGTLKNTTHPHRRFLSNARVLGGFPVFCAKSWAPAEHGKPFDGLRTSSHGGEALGDHGHRCLGRTKRIHKDGMGQHPPPPPRKTASWTALGNVDTEKSGC